MGLGSVVSPSAFGGAQLGGDGGVMEMGVVGGGVVGLGGDVMHVHPGVANGFASGFWEDEDQAYATTPSANGMNAGASSFVPPISPSAHGQLSSTAASFVPSSSEAS